MEGQRSAYPTAAANRTVRGQGQEFKVHTGEERSEGVVSLTSANLSVAVRHFLSESTKLSLVTANGSLAGCVCVCTCMCACVCVWVCVGVYVQYNIEGIVAHITGLKSIGK